MAGSAADPASRAARQQPQSGMPPSQEPLSPRSVSSTPQDSRSRIRQVSRSDQDSPPVPSVSQSSGAIGNSHAASSVARDTSPATSSDRLHSGGASTKQPYGNTSSGNLVESSSKSSLSARSDASHSQRERGVSPKTAATSRAGQGNTPKKDREERGAQNGYSFLTSSPSIRRRPHNLRTNQRNASTSAANPRTAPLEPDSKWSEMRGRTQSTDRSVGSDDEASMPQKQPSEDNFLKKFKGQLTTSRDAFVSHFKNTRSGSGSGSSERPSFNKKKDRDLEVIRLPLKDQVQITRIKKSLQEAKDKTEYWMPALAYRAIEFVFLNHNAITSEGLYRQPGSVIEIQKLERMFEKGPDYDVDLLKMEYVDVNAVSSMLKAWLRLMPDELLPKASQDRISEKTPDAMSCPRVMRNVLSRLPPEKYYTLFAITCHLSLLNAHQDENKMDFNSILICIKNSIKIDTHCFRLLVLDWRSCWQGCWTEEGADPPEGWDKEWFDEEGLDLADGTSTHVPSTQSRSETSGSRAASGLSRKHSMDSASPAQSQQDRLSEISPPGSSKRDSKEKRNMKKRTSKHSDRSSTGTLKRNSGRRPASIATNNPAMEFNDPTAQFEFAPDGGVKLKESAAGA